MFQGDPYIFDSGLSEEGFREVAQLRADLADHPMNPELLIVSPLTRAIQTCLGGFKTHLATKDVTI